MQPEARKYLFDIRRAAGLIVGFCSDRTFEDYVGDDMLKSAVERQFGVIGEALVRLAKTEPTMAEQVTDHRRIIAFRNILVHGYATVDDRIVWGVVEASLPPLMKSVDALLARV